MRVQCSVEDAGPGLSRQPPEGAFVSKSYGPVLFAVGNVADFKPTGTSDSLTGSMVLLARYCGNPQLMFPQQLSFE